MEKHYYKNHQQVISVLTTEYGFTYTGVGDNAEECFFKDSIHPERIFIHPMFCLYNMRSSREITTPRLHNAEFKSSPGNEQSQAAAFYKLLAYLDEVAVKKPFIATGESISKMLALLDEDRAKLKAMAVDNGIGIESKKTIPLIYANVLAYRSQLSNIMFLVK